MIHPWHDLSLGKKSPEIVTAFIEIPSGSKIKYELDKESGLMRVDRILSSCQTYPGNYGFLPQTYCDDKDPLDVLVLSQSSFIPGSIVDVRVIGVMKMIDQNEIDDKVIAVPSGDPHFSAVQDLDHLPPHLLLEIRNFFETYKILDKKSVSIEKFLPKKDAIEIIKASIALYEKHKKELRA